MTGPPAVASLADARHGVYVALVVPFGELGHGGRVYRRGEIGIPRDVRSLRVNQDHCPGSVLGHFRAAVEAVDGVWAAVELNDRGRELVALGHRRVSLEADRDGRLRGLALCVGIIHGLPSARIFSPPVQRCADCREFHAAGSPCPPAGICTEPRCAAPCYARGLCLAHFRRLVLEA